MTAFILVHGTTQAPAGWDLLAAELRRRGHGATAVELPTDKPDWTPADYALIAAAQAGDAGDDRVVVAHSGAGVLLPGIAQEVGADLAVWLAAYVPDFAGPSGCAGPRASAWALSPSRSTRVTARTCPSLQRSPACSPPCATGIDDDRIAGQEARLRYSHSWSSSQPGWPRSPGSWR